MTKKMVTDGFVDASESQVAPESRGLHLMLVGLCRPFQPGEKVAVNLHFARSGTVNHHGPRVRGGRSGMAS